jgi:hypothetical protein
MPAHSASEDARKRAYVAGIHVFLASKEDVDGRDKPGHDALGSIRPNTTYLSCSFLPPIPAESWDGAPDAPEGAARLCACALRRLRFSRSAALRRRCCRTFAARLGSSSIASRLCSADRRRKSLGVRTRRRGHACASSGPVAMGRPTQGRFSISPDFACGRALP